MKRPTRWIVLATVVSVAAFAGWHYGYRLIAKVRGQRTVADITDAHSADVQRRVGVTSWPAALTIIAIKDEQRLEVWRTDGAQPVLLRTYPFTRSSGTLGPKLREGDLQIPEGSYTAESLNPNSRFHLAVRVDYPNAFDRLQGARDGRTELGGDIMIHGGAATVGCIPIGDRAIEELFVLVAHAGAANTRILIAPTDFRLGHAPPATDLPWAASLYSTLAHDLAAYPRD